MVTIYVKLILAGRKTLDDVPANLREEVSLTLLEMGL